MQGIRNWRSFEGRRTAPSAQFVMAVTSHGIRRHHNPTKLSAGVTPGHFGPQAGLLYPCQSLLVRAVACRKCVVLIDVQPQSTRFECIANACRNPTRD
jgi:hypothetical protein